jgi:hypothetical protein
VLTLHLGLLSFFGVIFPQKHVFLKGIFKWNVLKHLYYIYSFPNMPYYFLQSNLETYKFWKMHKFCQILCFILEICHNFKSYQNMLTISGFIFYIISYKFSLNNIYIASHLHVKKDSWTFFRPWFLINNQKNENLNVF